MGKTKTILWSFVGVLLAMALNFPSPSVMGSETHATGMPVFTARDPSRLEAFAAREVRRYGYQLTGELACLDQLGEKLPEHGIVIVIKTNKMAITWAIQGSFASELEALGAESYLIKSIGKGSKKVVLLAGGDPVGVLYAAYRLAEIMGARFYLHGDELPDQKTAWKLPDINECSRPLFRLRGIQPFHDFPEGPDWWNAEDYRAVIGQLPKMRMNFFGLHTYPEGSPNAEPTVWMGLPQDIGAGDQVKFSYASSYQNTLRGNWGYGTKKTSDFSFGISQLFDRDAYGAEVMYGLCPNPASLQDNNELFARTASLLRSSFELARALGVKTCQGTETPLTVPKTLQDHLKSLNKEPTNSAVQQELYEGIFQRISQTMPLDYYWFWTPETWTWEGTKDAQLTATTNDLKSALQAHAKVKPGFQLATCGWVLGPQQDRALFNTFLPKDMAVSCINREVGRTPVDSAFANVYERSKWAIPWLEDDPGLTAPQLWVGRMRRDANDALRYGCDGLMGIHWRTRVIGPTVSALSQAAWNQDSWSPLTNKSKPARPGPDGGKQAAFSDHTFTNADLPVIYQTVRYDFTGYHLPCSNGIYKVTLKFCEPAYKERGKRIFSVKIEDKLVIEHLDIFARVGLDTALDYKFDQVAVSDGSLDLEFIPETEYPCLAGIVAESDGRKPIKINCGGPAVADYQGDWPFEPVNVAAVFPSTSDFYLDWTTHQFGSEIAHAAASLFSRIDGRLPRPVDWVEGPGGTKPDTRAWKDVAKEYDFVAEFAVLGSKVQGVGNKRRFQYWADNFHYMKSIAELNCLWGQYNNTTSEVLKETSAGARRALATARLLPLRIQMINKLKDIHGYLLATTENPGELGVIANWEQHIIPPLLGKSGEELARFLWSELPPEACLPRSYAGPTRIIMTTKPSTLAPGDAFNFKVAVISEKTPTQVSIYWRKLGAQKFSCQIVPHFVRGVYQGNIAAESLKSDDFEYYIVAREANGHEITYPATAPKLNQTVVIGP